MSGSAMTNVK